ncbi:MAG TPA: hypothetical protein VJ757_09750 [Pseudonocardiaceae bacterium]|nr:hypothetical protein [Pseudonocardiaceae bacterium]
MSIKKMTLLRTLTCTIGDQCPAIERIDGGGFRVTGTNVDDPANEATVEVPDSLLPELTSLEIHDWPQWLKAHRKTPGDMLRIQTLDHYGVSSDDQDYLGYLKGAPAPISPYREPWFQQLRDEREAGQVRRNLHVLCTPINSYLSYACEWGYAYNVQHGQDVRILNVAEHLAAGWMFRTGDYWVVEGQHVVLCRYSPEGAPEGLVEVGADNTAGFIAAGEMAWQLGTPFSEWWAAHPEYHRDPPAA